MAALAPLSPSYIHTHHNLDRKIENYQYYLDDLIKRLGLSEQNMDLDCWAKLACLTTQEILDDIYSKKNTVIELLLKPRLSLDQMQKMIRQDPKLSRLPFDKASSILESKHMLPFTSREKPKNRERVQRKLEERNASTFNGFAPRYFTTINDFLAFSIPLTDLKDFEPVVKHLKDRAESVGGKIGIKKESEKANWQSINEKGKFLDIVQFVQVYLPEIGLIEFEVAHPFARYTFDRDSDLREHPGLKKKLPKLWDDGFYKFVRKFIVDKANGCLCDDELHQRHHEIMQKAAVLHAKFKTNVPEDLKAILKNL